MSKNSTTYFRPLPFLFTIIAMLMLMTALNAQPTTQHPSQSISVKFEGISKKLIDAPEASFMNNLFTKTRQPEDDDRERSSIAQSPDWNEDGADSSLQKNYFEEGLGPSHITVLSNWEGMTSSFSRSDNVIAVGPNHVVQIVNSNTYSSFIRVWDKSGNLIINKKYLKDITGLKDYGDPNIIYDQQADRFIISTLSYSTRTGFTVFVSQTNDPTGAYYIYLFETPGFPDYPKLSAWGNSYFITIAHPIPYIFALDRTKMLSGIAYDSALVFKPPVLPMIGWQGLSPVNQTGAKPVKDGEPAVIARVVDGMWEGNPDGDRLELFLMNVNWDDPLSSTMNGPNALPISKYNSDLCGINVDACLDQKNSEVKIWPLSDFLTDKVQYRNFGDHESIVCVHVQNNGQGIAAQRWYELRRQDGSDWTIYQQGTYAPDLNHRFMGSITINDEGTIALGYNISSSTLYPGIRVTGRRDCDDLNMMTAPEKKIINGTAANSTLNYGDYNCMVTDPVDGSFWFTAQYNKSPWWSTNIVHFTIDGCNDQKLTNETAPSQFSLYPSIADHFITASFNATKTQLGSIAVFDLNGRKVYFQKFETAEGSVKMSVPVSSLKDGYYFLRVATGTEVFNGKFLVQHE